MGEFDNTAFVATADTEAVAEALAKLFEASGRALVERPPLRKAPFPDPMQYGNGATSSRWAAAVLPGKKWTIIKTAPFELLCEAVDGRPRIALLAQELACDAFQLNVYDGDSHILVEANAAGAFRISGFNAATGPGPYHGFPMDGAARTTFGLIRVGKPLTSAIDLGVAEGSRRLREVLHGDPDASDNTVQVGHLIPYEPLANALVICAELTPARPLREPLTVPLVVERTASEARYRLQLPAGELWLESQGTKSLSPRTSAEAAAIAGALASWLDVSVSPGAERVPTAVDVFGDTDTGDLSIPGDGGMFPIGLDLDEARGRVTLRELDANVAGDIVRACARAWSGESHGEVMVPHVERVPVPPHRSVLAIACGDQIVIACDHDFRTTLWTWRPGEQAVQIADLAARLEQLTRGPKRHEVTLRVGYGKHGHAADDVRDVFVIDPSDGDRRTLIERQAGADTFSWSSDGKKLVMQINAGKARSYLQLYDANGAKLARSPETIPLHSPRWVGPVIYCRRYDHENIRHATWRPSDQAVEVANDWFDRSPSGVMLRGDAEVTGFGEHRSEGILRPAWTEPLVWLDDDTCVLVREPDDAGNGQRVAVDVRDGRVRPVLASRRAVPCARLDDVIVAIDGGFRLWWGRIVT